MSLDDVIILGTIPSSLLKRMEEDNKSDSKNKIIMKMQLVDVEVIASSHEGEPKPKKMIQFGVDPHLLFTFTNNSICASAKGNDNRFVREEYRVAVQSAGAHFSSVGVLQDKSEGRDYDASCGVEMVDSTWRKIELPIKEEESPSLPLPSPPPPLQQPMKMRTAEKERTLAKPTTSAAPATTAASEAIVDTSDNKTEKPGCGSNSSSGTAITPIRATEEKKHGDALGASSADMGNERTPAAAVKPAKATSTSLPFSQKSVFFGQTFSDLYYNKTSNANGGMDGISMFLRQLILCLATAPQTLLGVQRFLASIYSTAHPANDDAEDAESRVVRAMLTEKNSADLLYLMRLLLVRNQPSQGSEDMTAAATTAGRQRNTGSADATTKMNTQIVKQRNELQPEFYLLVDTIITEIKNDKAVTSATTQGPSSLLLAAKQEISLEQRRRIANRAYTACAREMIRLTKALPLLDSDQQKKEYVELINRYKAHQKQVEQMVDRDLILQYAPAQEEEVVQTKTINKTDESNAHTKKGLLQRSREEGENHSDTLDLRSAGKRVKLDEKSDSNNKSDDDGKSTHNKKETTPMSTTGPAYLYEHLADCTEIQWQEGSLAPAATASLLSLSMPSPSNTEATSTTTTPPAPTQSSPDSHIDSRRDTLCNVFVSELARMHMLMERDVMLNKFYSKEINALSLFLSAFELEREREENADEEEEEKKGGTANRDDDGDGGKQQQSKKTTNKTKDHFRVSNNSKNVTASTESSSYTIEDAVLTSETLFHKALFYYNAMHSLFQQVRDVLHRHEVLTARMYQWLERQQLPLADLLLAHTTTKTASGGDSIHASAHSCTSCSPSFIEEIRLFMRQQRAPQRLLLRLFLFLKDSILRTLERDVKDYVALRQLGIYA